MGVLAFSTSENCARLKYKISRENLRWIPLHTPLQKMCGDKISNC